MSNGFRQAGAAALAFGLGLPMLASMAMAAQVTDIVGRTVDVRIPVERVILGEGRQTYVTAILDKDNPFKRVVGWRDDFPKADPNTYAAYLERYPEIARLPVFGGMKEGTFDIEQAIALDPDVLLMNLESKTAADEAKLVEKLDKLGIPVVYIDFRDKPFENTEPSLRLMGKLFGNEAVAEDFIEFRAAEIALVTGRLESADSDRPLVMMERAAGFSDDCCMSFGNENFGRMVEIAGGTNLAGEIIPGTFGVVNPEQIVAADPDVVIVTGANWQAYVPGGKWVDVGPGSDAAAARDKLEALMQRPAFIGSKAAREGRAHAIWHQFYNSPYQFVAIQAIAKWLHPDLFEDLDPSATMAALHERYLPITYRPGYWVSLESTH